jgi:hypothetical protein
MERKGGRYRRDLGPPASLRACAAVTLTPSNHNDHPKSRRSAGRTPALDEVRAGEARRLAQDGYEPVLKKSRWCLLKRKTNLTPKQRPRLRELLRYNLKTVRAYQGERTRTS